MSEYWKSTPKYWCKHCSAYVKDTPFERKQHENTGKHQGNLKRFLRGIQNGHERDERDKERAKAEIARLNKVVNGDSSASVVPGQSTMTTKTATKAAPSAADQKRQWAQLTEMGIAVPTTIRGEMSIPGDWEILRNSSVQDAVEVDPLSRGVHKRKLEEGEDDPEDMKEKITRKGWGSSIKSYPGSRSDGTSDDLDDLLSISVIKKEKSHQLNSKNGESDMKVGLSPESDFKSTSSSRVKAGGEAEPTILQPESAFHANAIITKQDVDASDEIKKEEDVQASLLETNTSETAPLPVFKKRRVKTQIH